MSIMVPRVLYISIYLLFLLGSIISGPIYEPQENHASVLAAANPSVLMPYKEQVRALQEYLQRQRYKQDLLPNNGYAGNINTPFTPPILVAPQSLAIPTWQPSLTQMARNQPAAAPQQDPPPQPQIQSRSRQTTKNASPLEIMSLLKLNNIEKELQRLDKRISRRRDRIKPADTRQLKPSPRKDELRQMKRELEGMKKMQKELLQRLADEKKRREEERATALMKAASSVATNKKPVPIASGEYRQQKLYPGIPARSPRLPIAKSPIKPLKQPQMTQESSAHPTANFPTSPAQLQYSTLRQGSNPRCARMNQYVNPWSPLYNPQLDPQNLRYNAGNPLNTPYGHPNYNPQLDPCSDLYNSSHVLNNPGMPGYVPSLDPKNPFYGFEPVRSGGWRVQTQAATGGEFPPVPARSVPVAPQKAPLIPIKGCLSSNLRLEDTFIQEAAAPRPLDSNRPILTNQDRNMNKSAVQRYSSLLEARRPPRRISLNWQRRQMGLEGLEMERGWRRRLQPFEYRGRPRPMVGAAVRQVQSAGGRCPSRQSGVDITYENTTPQRHYDDLPGVHVVTRKDWLETIPPRPPKKTCCYGRLHPKYVQAMRATEQLL